MAITMTSAVKATIEWLMKDTLTDGTVIQDQGSAMLFNKTLATGTAVDTADRVWHKKQSIGATTNLDLDLSGGSSLSIFGTNVDITFVKIKSIFIKNHSTTSGDELRVGPNASGTPLSAHILTPFNAVNTAVVVVGADSAMVLASCKDGWAVTATTADLLRIRNPGANAIECTIVIIGTSA